ncbi:hypothetical protein PoB_007544200 [Plakobranchus ocellatus]|uniref:Uncharacterized protein n=1 Tax=Plakobranchus ocellatus TaxID=259542 RepID=A0AAV4DY34_9GAST|nr:hypothetical protein PoB_007544200 [Plakobranchus ocellatus]
MMVCAEESLPKAHPARYVDILLVSKEKMMVCTEENLPRAHPARYIDMLLVSKDEMMVCAEESLPKAHQARYIDMLLVSKDEMMVRAPGCSTTVRNPHLTNRRARGRGRPPNTTAAISCGCPAGRRPASAAAARQL